MEWTLDFNPLTGERCTLKTEGDRLYITNEQDVSSFLDDTAELRAREGYSQRGIKNDKWHYARIPNGVALEMAQKHGVNLYAKDPDWKAIFRCINTHYPYLKTTTKTHA